MKISLIKLSHPVYLIALSLLLINDFFLKRAFDNFLTGKISDFAGLFVFSVFLAEIFQTRKTHVFVLTGIAFLFWKSGFSEPVILFWNHHVSFLPVGRVVDYSDLVALCILPLAWRFHTKEIRSFKLKITPVIPVLISLFAIMATSYMNEEQIDREVVLTYPKKELNEKILVSDSVRIMGTKFTDKLIDTVELYMNDHRICNSGFYTTVIAESATTAKTRLKFTYSRYSCEKNEKYTKYMKERIDQLIIDLSR